MFPTFFPVKSLSLSCSSATKPVSLACLDWFHIPQRPRPIEDASSGPGREIGGAWRTFPKHVVKVVERVGLHLWNFIRILLAFGDVN